MRVKCALVPKMGDYKNIVVEEVELADPGPYEVRLKVVTCTICHSDIHALTGTLNTTAPVPPDMKLLASSMLSEKK